MYKKRYHNIFDIDNCNDNINDKAKIREFLLELTKAVEMEILEGPVIAEGVPENPGLSAFVIVDFSHISIHAFSSSEYKEIMVDVFSCKEYDRQKVQQYCQAYFSTLDSVIRQKEVWWG